METASAIQIITVPEMEGLNIGIRYFDDATTIYMAPSVFKEINSGKIRKLRYMILSYRKNQKDIISIANEIVDEMRKAPPGHMTEIFIQNILQNSDVHVAPDITINTNRPSPHQYSETGKVFKLTSTAYDNPPIDKSN